MALIFSFLYPLILFLVFRYLDMSLNDVILLKAYPLLMSIYITILIGVSYLKENSFILKIVTKFSKKEISEFEKKYIQHSTLFWISVSSLNIILHVMVLLSLNDYYWVGYTTFGWYFVFGLGGGLQYLHRKYIFLKRAENA